MQPGLCAVYAIVYGKCVLHCTLMNEPVSVCVPLPCSLVDGWGGNENIAWEVRLELQSIKLTAHC